MTEMPIMSFNSCALSVPVCFLLLGVTVTPRVDAQVRTGASSVTCPATIEVTESASLVPGWTSAPGKRVRKFENASIYNGEPGGKEFELAPDEQKDDGAKVLQTWRLRGYRTMNVFLRCRYQDTAAALQIDLPLRIETCTFRFSITKKGAIVGSRELVCR